jgi:hypothetical protein
MQALALSSIGWLPPGGVSQYSLYSLAAVGIIKKTCPVLVEVWATHTMQNNTALFEFHTGIAARYLLPLSKRSAAVNPLIHSSAALRRTTELRNTSPCSLLPVHFVRKRKYWARITLTRLCLPSPWNSFTSAMSWKKLVTVAFGDFD